MYVVFVLQLYIIFMCILMRFMFQVKYIYIVLFTI